MKNLIVLCLLLTGSALFAAPAPFAKPPRSMNQADMYGTWKYQYGGGTGTFTFYRDGKRENLLLDTAGGFFSWKTIAPDFSLQPSLL